MLRKGPASPAWANRGGGRSLPTISITRRAFLALPLGWVVAPLWRAHAQAEELTADYTARVALLYGALRLDVTGTIRESIDRGAGRYEVHIAGQGAGLLNRVESSGTIRDGRWAPIRTQSLFLVHGRESRVEASYDYSRRAIGFKSRSETFFLRRVRTVDDHVPMPDAAYVDDVISAALNYADARWIPGPDGTLVTHVVRRRRGPREGSDDVEGKYHAEIVPFVLKAFPDPETGKPTALFDLTRFSSWARETEPARIVFGFHRRPELITASLILGTSVTIRISGGTASWLS